MAGVRGLRLLLALLLPVVSTSTAGTVVRINKAVLSYVSEFGKVPLQEALKVDDQHFLDQSSEVLQTVRIQVPAVRVTRLHLKFLPDFGIYMWAAANFTVKVFCVPESLELMVPVTLQSDLRVTQSSLGTPKISISTFFPHFGRATVLDDNKKQGPLLVTGAEAAARADMVKAQTFSPLPGVVHLSPALLATLQKDIKAILSSKLNLNLANLVDNINIHMGTLIGLNPVSPESQICYYMMNPPSITRDYISMNLNAVLFLLGNPIILPMDTPHLELPELVGNRAAMATLALSQNLFDSVLLLLQKAGALNLDITAHLQSDDNPLNTSVLSKFIPEVAHQVPEYKPVVLKVRLGAMPVAAFHNRSITLRLQPLVEVLATSSNSAFQSLFSLTVVVNLNLQLSVSKAKLYGTTSVVGDMYLAVASSNVGSINLDRMYLLMNTVFEKPLLEHFNALLGIGISLPTVTNLHYVNPDICINEPPPPISRMAPREGREARGRGHARWVDLRRSDL
ncbi:BPI fold containing family B member 2 [Ictidomys tridecemlineatus]|nr:BPI fold containing family B member 2 [Ictidomys tridecemlineatus]